MSRPKGSKNQKTIDWDTFGKTLTDEGLPRLLEILRKSDDETFLRTYIPLLEYFKPKLKRIETVQDKDTDTTIRVLWDDIPPC